MRFFLLAARDIRYPGSMLFKLSSWLQVAKFNWPSELDNLQRATAGHITKQEQKTLNQQENAVSKEIGK